MALWLERSCVEAAFFVVLAVATAALHYSSGFSYAFASLASHPASAAAAAASNSPVYNYACLLAAATAAYATARTAARYAAAALPPTVKSSPAARRGVLALCLPATALICYVGAGYPQLSGSVAAKWVAGNWERNGERDLRWCGRLFTLLFFWQAVLSGGVAACRALSGSVESFRARLLLRLLPGAAARDRSHRDRIISKGGSSAGDRVLPAAEGGEKGKSSPSPGENGAPGWEKEKAPGYK